MGTERKEQETKFDKVRRILAYISFGILAIGALIGSAVLVGGSLMDIAVDQSVGKEASNYFKKRKQRKSS